MIRPADKKKLSTYAPERETVIIVDGQNNEIGSVTRAKMRAEKLIHRASYILVFNPDGELFIQKRTATKDIYPGYYDIAAGGVVLEGESYEESASRELFEELGVNAPLTEHFDHYYEDSDNKVWGRIFSCRHSGPFVLQEEEIESGVFLPPDTVLEISATAPFTPDGILILRRFLAST